MFEKFKIKITILASLIVTSFCLFFNQSFFKSGITIIMTIIIFYILGGFVEIFLNSNLQEIDDIERELDEDDEIQEQGEDLSDEDDENIEMHNNVEYKTDEELYIDEI